MSAADVAMHIMRAYSNPNNCTQHRFIVLTGEQSRSNIILANSLSEVIEMNLIPHVLLVSFLGDGVQ